MLGGHAVMWVASYWVRGMVEQRIAEGLDV
jgi:hypothetical protein